MKKTLKVLGLLVVAAAMFTGCKKDTDDGPRDIAKPLFDESELTVNATSFELENAKWTIRQVDADDEGIQREGAEITCSITSTGDPDTSVDFDFVATGIVEAPGELNSTQKEMLEAVGYTVSGKTASYCYEVNKKKYDELCEKYKNVSELDPTDHDLMAALRVTGMLDTIGGLDSDDFDSIKTNADKSKYYATNHHGEKWYFSKVQ